MYILSFLGIFFSAWYFKENLGGENSLKLKSEKLPDVKRNNAKVLIGKGEKGKVYHNFLVYPHLLVAGHTGYGKTNFIRSILKQIDGDVLLIDMKRGKDYNGFEVAAQTIEEAKEILKSVVDNMRYERKKHLFVVIDEAYEFVPRKWYDKDKKAKYHQCLDYCSEIARLGRSFNVHLIYATQYPTADVIDGQIKQNMESRVVFRLPEDHASEVALDDTGAEELPAGVKGRAIYKNDLKQIIQTYEVEVKKDEHENTTQENEGEQDTIIIR